LRQESSVCNIILFTLLLGLFEGELIKRLKTVFSLKLCTLVNVLGLRLQIGLLGSAHNWKTQFGHWSGVLSLIFLNGFESVLVCHWSLAERARAISISLALLFEGLSESRGGAQVTTAGALVLLL
jgi:hypothetical protein